MDVEKEGLQPRSSAGSPQTKLTDGNNNNPNQSESQVSSANQVFEEFGLSGTAENPPDNSGKIKKTSPSTATTSPNARNAGPTRARRQPAR